MLQPSTGHAGRAQSASAVALVSGMLALDSKAISTNALFRALLVTRGTEPVKMSSLVAEGIWTVSLGVVKRFGQGPPTMYVLSDPILPDSVMPHGLSVEEAVSRVIAADGCDD